MAQQKKKHEFLSFPFYLLGGFFLLVLISPAIAAPANSCKYLMENKCLDCHFETRICQKIAKNKGKRSWKRTIKSMIRHGAELTPDEQTTLVGCFIDRDPEILSFCGMK